MGLATKIDAWPLAARISSCLGAEPNCWRVCVTGEGLEAETAEALRVELESLIQEPVPVRYVYSAVDLDELGRSEPATILCLLGQWDDLRWREADSKGLMRKGSTILVLCGSNVLSMPSYAPHLWSWVGGDVWEISLEDS